MLRGQTYLNNSIVAINDIGVGDNALLCVTDNPDCCKHPNGNTSQGEFYYPNNSRVRFNVTDPWYRDRGPQVVRLSRRNAVLSPTGVYKCEILDSTGMNINISINLTGMEISSSILLQVCMSSVTILKNTVLCSLLDVSIYKNT